MFIQHLNYHIHLVTELIYWNVSMICYHESDLLKLLRYVVQSYNSITYILQRCRII